MQHFFIVISRIWLKTIDRKNGVCVFVGRIVVYLRLSGVILRRLKFWKPCQDDPFQLQPKGDQENPSIQPRPSYWPPLQIRAVPGRFRKLGFWSAALKASNYEENLLKILAPPVGTSRRDRALTFKVKVHARFAHRRRELRFCCWEIGDGDVALEVY
jgi:hypothetical protein